MTIEKIRTKKRKHPLYGLATGEENTVVTASSLITAELSNWNGKAIKFLVYGVCTMSNR